MSRHGAQIEWRRDPLEKFTDQRYSRRHLLRFDGGVEFAGSSATSSVPLPYSDASAVDPEEMFVAALASCHMLWFLSLAARDGFVVESYRDDPVGLLARGADGRTSMTTVTLRPHVEFGSTAPGAEVLAALHHEAHAACFLANSVRTDVRCEPQP